jgi:hypothetical protein
LGCFKDEGDLVGLEELVVGPEWGERGQTVHPLVRRIDQQSAGVEIVGSVIVKEEVVSYHEHCRIRRRLTDTQIQIPVKFTVKGEAVLVIAVADGLRSGGKQSHHPGDCVTN